MILICESVICESGCLMNIPPRRIRNTNPKHVYLATNLSEQRRSAIQIHSIQTLKIWYWLCNPMYNPINLICIRLSTVFQTVSHLFICILLSYQQVRQLFFLRFFAYWPILLSSRNCLQILKATASEWLCLALVRQEEIKRLSLKFGTLQSFCQIWFTLWLAFSHAFESMKYTYADHYLASQNHF